MMKPFRITGGTKSPSAIIFGNNAEHAKNRYNFWLYLTYGRRDEGVRCEPFQSNQIVLLNGQAGTMTYAADCRGYKDPQFA